MIAPEALDGQVLVSGFWGLSRHINYLGEFLMASALTLSLGHPGVLGPWLYPLYYLGLLVPRQIDDDPGKFPAQFVEQHVDRPGIDNEVLRRGCLGSQNPQGLGDLDHRPLDEQAVDARRLLQGFAQSTARSEIQLERDGAEMGIEIDEGDPLLALGGQQPGTGDG